MHPRFEDIEEFTLVGLTVDTTMEHNQDLEDRPKVRRDLVARRMEIPNIKDENTLYAACWSRDGGDPRNCTHMACYQVSPGSDTPSGMTQLTIPKGRYAVFTHRGKEDTIHQTWEEIFRWAASSGHTNSRNGIAFEVLDERFTMGDDSEHDIYIPIIST